MINMLTSLVSQISLLHVGILFLLGIALFGGTIGGHFFQKMKIPQVVGYIMVGVILGSMGLNLIDKNVIEVMRPFSYFALGLIGFLIGGELKIKTLRKYGKQFMWILMFEGVSAFIIVMSLVVFAGSYFITDKNLLWALGLLLGAIASATAPAATTDVLWEYKTKGPLTTTIHGIVALDDALALILFAIASSIAMRLIGDTTGGILSMIFYPLYRIVASIAIGAVSGLILCNINKKHHEEDRLLAMSVGMVMLVLGITLVMKFSILLAAMALGSTMVNYTPKKTEELFKLVENFTPPIYVLFFVLFGAKLSFGNMSAFMLTLAGVYLVGRTSGKMFGAYIGARLGGSPKSIQKYLPLCLFSQAGVAIGLSILAGQKFPGEIGNAIVVVITATTFVVQLIGPSCVKLGLSKAGEIGMNITEEDLIKQSKAGEIMDKDIPLIYEDMPLSAVLKIFSERDNLHYPVVNADKEFLGVVTIDNIKNTFMSVGLNDFLLGHDLMEESPAIVKVNTSMPEVLEILKDFKIDYLPVVSEENKLEGFLEIREIQKLISKKISQLQCNAG